MPRRNGSNFGRRRGNREEVRIYKTGEISGGKSDGSVFSCITNGSEAGTYEIEICERPSPDRCSPSTRALPSNTSLSSDNSRLFDGEKSSKILCHPGLSRSKRKVLSVKMPDSNSKNGLMQSYYPCLCVAHQPVKDECETRVEFSDKNTSAVVETVDRAQSCADSDSVSSALSLTREDVGRKSSASENDCSCSKCDSVTTSCQTKNTENSSDSVSGSSNQNANLSSASSRTSCDPSKSGNLAKESSGNGRDKSPEGSPSKKCSSKEVKEGKTTVVLELIREEKEKPSLNKGEESKGCNCDDKNYDERLKKLENLCFASGTRGECGKGTGENVAESEDSCDCATNILHFAQIKLRIDALEKLYMDSIEEEKGKKEVKLLPENVDEGTRTAIELAKIKKRLVDLEMKIINSNVSNHPTDQSVKKVESSGENGELNGSLRRGGVTEPRTKQSHKEIQVIDLEKESEFRNETEDGWKYVRDNRTPVYHFAKETEPCHIITYRDEAMQTASTSFDDCSDESELGAKAESPKHGLVSTESRNDGIRFCKECHYCITQNLEAVGRRSAENPWPGGQPHENIEEENVNLGKGRKCFGEYPMKYSDCLRPNGSGKLYLRQAERYYDSKPKRKYKNLKLCTKYPATNLRQIFPSNYEWDVECGEEYEPFISDREFDNKFESNFVNPKSKGNEKSMENARIPHQSFHIYRSQQTRHSLVFPGEGPSHASRSRMRASPPDLSGRKDRCRESLDDAAETPRQCHVRPFAWHQSSETSQRKAFYRYRGISREAAESESRGRSPFKNMKPWNAVECTKTGRKMKILALFEEVCNSTHNKTFTQSSSMSVAVVRVGVEAGKSPFNPWKKLMRKLSHSHSLDNKTKWPTFPVNGCNSENPQNVNKEKVQDKSKAFKLNSVLKRKSSLQDTTTVSRPDN